MLCPPWFAFSATRKSAWPPRSETVSVVAAEVTRLTSARKLGIIQEPPAIGCDLIHSPPEPLNHQTHCRQVKFRIRPFTIQGFSCSFVRGAPKRTATTRRVDRG